MMDAVLMAIRQAIRESGWQQLRTVCSRVQALTNPFHSWQQCCSTPEASMMLAALMAISARMYMKQKF
jgi:hypothetical protein